MGNYRNELSRNKLNSFFFPFWARAPAFEQEVIGREAESLAPRKAHRLQIRSGALKFRLNDGNLRIGRGFGKRSTPPMSDYDYKRIDEIMRGILKEQRSLIPTDSEAETSMTNH